jgi:hypothetical protein
MLIVKEEDFYRYPVALDLRSLDLTKSLWDHAKPFHRLTCVDHPKFHGLGMDHKVGKALRFDCPNNPGFELVPGHI